MSNIPGDLKYAKSHEWIRHQEGDLYTVGITDYAQEALGDVVYVEPSEVGATVGAGDMASVVESVKAASDIYSPVSGEIVAFNQTLETSPETLNTDPYDSGWIFTLKVTDDTELNNLMSAAEYQATLDGDAES